MLGPSNFGGAIQFVCLLVLVTLAAAPLLAYLAHVFLVVAEQTAGGLDEIAWARGPWYDWILQALHLGWLVVLWLLPLGIVLKVVGPASLGSSVALWAGVPAALFWLLFPVMLLSSFSTGSAWTVFRAEVPRRMAGAPGGTFAFYLCTAPLCALGAASLYAALAHEIFVALPVFGTVLLLYGRLVGRYTRVLGRVRLKETEPVAEQAPAKGPKKERPRKKKKKPTVKVHDPWAVPEEEEAAAKEEEATLPVEGYGVVTEEAVSASAEREQAPPPVDGYGVSAEEPPRRPKEAPFDGEPSLEPKRTASEHERPLPDHPFLEGVWAFPWYVANLGVWGLVTLLLLGWGYLYALLQSVRPW